MNSDTANEGFTLSRDEPTSNNIANYFDWGLDVSKLNQPTSPCELYSRWKLIYMIKIIN